MRRQGDRNLTALQLNTFEKKKKYELCYSGIGGRNIRNDRSIQLNLKNEKKPALNSYKSNAFENLYL